MERHSEQGRRERAIELRRAGWKFQAICQAVGRSHTWLAKWLRRVQAHGLAGLADRSRRPHQIWRQLPSCLVARILATRAALVARRQRRHAYAGIGAEAIRWELEQQRVRPLPSRSSIERVLRRAGRVVRGQPARRRDPQSYPAPRTTAVGDLHQTDLVGPRHLRGPRGVTRLFALHTVDPVAHAGASSIRRDKRTESLCAHLVAAWTALGVPRTAQFDNERAAVGGQRTPAALEQAVRLGLLLGVHVVFVPDGEPGRQGAVERCNDLWQERVFRRHPCPDARALRRHTAAFLRYVHFGKPHRALTVQEHGTRFPGVLLAQARPAGRRLPRGFTLAAYRDPRGGLRLPLARGRVSFIRRVAADGTIEANGRRYLVGRRLAGQYVTATLFIRRQELVVKLHHQIFTRFPVAIAEALVAPLLPLPRGRL